MINPEHEKAKAILLKHKTRIKKLGIKEKIVKLPMGYGADKRYCQQVVNKNSFDTPKYPTKRVEVKSDTYNDFVKLYKKGLTITEMAKKKLISKQAVYYHLKELTQKKKEEESKEKTDVGTLVGDLVEKGFTGPQIAEKLQLTIGTINYRVRLYKNAKAKQISD